MAARINSNEILLTRVYDAPVGEVWDAWTSLERVEKWWGPRGFTLTTHGRELRSGGAWRFTMFGPDGAEYPNVTRYHVVEPLRKLVYDHGGSDDRPPLFRVTVTFAEANGKTTMDMAMGFASPEVAAEMAKFIKQAGGESTWDRLGEHLAEATSGRRVFVISYTVGASLGRVFEKWVSPAHLARWLPPAGARMRFLRSEIAPGKSTFFVISGEHGMMNVRAEYLAIEAPRRIVYLQEFVDERELRAPAPGAEIWPATLRTTVSFAEEPPGWTRVTVTSEPEGQTTAAEVEAFVRERPGMTLGWTGSFSALEALLDAEIPESAEES